jgi:predicted SAM-dependent methyltransferase
LRMIAKGCSEPKKMIIENFITEIIISYYNKVGLKKIKELGWKRPKRINLGSGSDVKAGYLNIDLFPGPELTLDLRRGLPFESDCCEFILAEHFFEHLNYPEEIIKVLTECYRVLKPGGTLRFSVPDTEWPLKSYAEGPNTSYFKECAKLNWHPTDCETMMEHINYHFRQMGEHLFAYDFETAKKALNKAGFKNATRAEYDDSIDAPHREIGSLFMLAVKE